MSQGRQTVTDVRVLRAIAHPVRNRILGELEARDHLRAADVAAELAIPANQASFHLRQLAKYGLVEEAPEHARDGRDRVWRRAGAGELDINPLDLRAQPGGEAVVAVWQRNALAEHVAALERAFALDYPEGVKVMVTDGRLRLTRAEAEELCEQLLDVQREWRERTRARGAVADERTYHVMQVVQPEVSGAEGAGSDTEDA